MNCTGKALVGVPVGEYRQRMNEFSIALVNGGVIAEAARQRQLTFVGHDGNPIGIAEISCSVFSDPGTRLCTLASGNAAWVS